MENDFENGKIIPIERGKEIRLEKLEERIQKVQEDAMLLYGRLLDLESEKQAQLDQELQRPTTEQNIELIFLLNQDLAEIAKDQDTLTSTIQESFNKLDELRERIYKIREIPAPKEDGDKN